MTTDPKLAEVEKAIQRAFCASILSLVSGHQTPITQWRHHMEPRVYESVLPVIRRLLDAEYQRGVVDGMKKGTDVP